jgi:hypothetical protein
MARVLRQIHCGIALTLRYTGLAALSSNMRIAVSQRIRVARIRAVLPL